MSGNGQNITRACAMPVVTEPYDSHHQRNRRNLFRCRYRRSRKRVNEIREHCVEVLRLVDELKTQMLDQFVDVLRVPLKMIPVRSFLGIALYRGSTATMRKRGANPSICGWKMSAAIVQPGTRTIARPDPASR